MSIHAQKLPLSAGKFTLLCEIAKSKSKGLWAEIREAIRRDSEKADEIHRHIEARKQEALENSIRSGLMRNL